MIVVGNKNTMGHSFPDEFCSHSWTQWERPLSATPGGKIQYTGPVACLHLISNRFENVYVIIRNFILYWTRWLVNTRASAVIYRHDVYMWARMLKSEMVNKVRPSQMLFTYTPYWRGRRGQKKRRGCSQRSSFSTAWCPCLRSTEQCSWEGG